MTTTYTQSLADFIDGYIHCALESSVAYSGQALADNFTVADIDPDTYGQMVADCKRFYDANVALFGEANANVAGDDFWSSRQGHGNGFDTNEIWEPHIREHLEKLAGLHPSFTLFDGGDGVLHSR